MNRLLQILLCFFLFIIIPLQIKAQEPQQQPTPEKNESLEQKLEDIVEATDEEVDYAYLLEELDAFLKNKVNLNKATFDELQRFFFLNDIQINNLLEHIRTNGKLMSLLELQSIDGFDAETINMLLPYVYVSGNVSDRQISIKDMLKRGDNQLFIRYQQYIEQQEGFSDIDDSSLALNPNSRYLGSSARIYTRYKYSYYNNISFGITAEKDQGEEFFRGTQKNGYDFYSAHFYVRNIGKIKSLAIGDYHAQFGQGLTFWSGLAFGKSADAINIRKNALGIRPYTSVDENLFMRGVAGTVAIKHFEISGFFSMKKRDGNLSLITDTLENEDELLTVSSLLETGYHRTPSEIEKKNTIDELMYGGNIQYRKRRFSFGLTGVRTELSHKIDKTFNLYNQFEFNDKENLNLGVDYSYIFRNINFFGEVSRSLNGGMAFCNGAIFNLDSRVSLSVLHRRFDKNYQSLYSSAFSEGSKVINEEGIFLGLMTSLSRAWKLTVYADNFNFPWLRYRVNAPSKGFDYLLQLNYKPSKTLEMYARYRHKNKALNNTDVTNGLYFIQDTEKENYRFEIKYRVTDDFMLKNRIEQVRYSIADNTYNGFTMYQDLQFKTKKVPFSVTLRYALFDTDNYDTRIYVYENDVLYASSFPSYYYKGSRVYVLLNYKVRKNLEFWLRVAQTYYNDRNVIGSGLDEIQGNTKTEVKAQMRLKF